MTDLPFLVRLLDDPSPVVGARVAARLRALGPGVWDEIGRQNIALTGAQRLALETLALDLHLSSEDATALLWRQWRELSARESETAHLERALCLLASWQCGSDVAGRGARALDELARDFDASGEAGDALALADFLFDHRGFRGALPAEFYEPRNSNLMWVLEEGTGLPISLACVFSLVGARVGLCVEGCNFPGHFLARDGRGGHVFDPYNRGRILSPNEVATLEKAAPHEMRASASAPEIIARVLRNLSVAYHHAGNGEHSGLMLSLLRAMDGD